MSSLNSFLNEQFDHKPQHTANIKGPKRIGTTDEDEGRRGNLRHDDNEDDGRVDQFEEDGLRDERRAG